MDVMVDLETVGTRPNAPIIAIGAFVVGSDTEFYHVIDLQSCVNTGAEIEADTFLWWMKQGDAARAAFNRPGVPLVQALIEFAAWLHPDAKVWGNGSDFDNVLLAESYRRCKIPQPWKYYHNRCYRTLKAMYPNVPYVASGVSHNALDDARNQARHLEKLL